MKKYILNYHKDKCQACSFIEDNKKEAMIPEECENIFPGINDKKLTVDDKAIRFPAGIPRNGLSGEIIGDIFKISDIS
jgi:hypothetical protein